MCLCLSDPCYTTHSSPVFMTPPTQTTPIDSHHSPLCCASTEHSLTHTVSTAHPKVFSPSPLTHWSMHVPGHSCSGHSGNGYYSTTHTHTCMHTPLNMVKALLLALSLNRPTDGVRERRARGQSSHHCRNTNNLTQTDSSQ